MTFTSLTRYAPVSVPSSASTGWTDMIFSDSSEFSAFSGSSMIISLILQPSAGVITTLASPFSLTILSRTTPLSFLNTTLSGIFVRSVIV